MKKRRIAAWAAACMLLTLVSATAFAWEETEDAQNEGDAQAETAAQSTWDAEAETDATEAEVYNKADDGTLVIVLDAGHGGTENGATRGSVLEKTLNLKIAQACRDALNSYSGVTVYMTRSGDTTLSLDARAAYAKSVGADVLVSMHVNAVGDAQTWTDGAEVLIPNGNYRAALTTQAKKVGGSILEQLSSSTGVTNRGFIQRNSSSKTYANGKAADYYGLIRAAVNRNISSLIIEHAFIDSDTDYNNYLSTDAKLQALGQADAAGIAAAYGLKKKSPSAADNGDAPFTDVYENEWFYPAVTFAYQNKLMNGTSATTFEPKGTTTRAMAAQILYNYACSRGAVSMEGGKTFEDVRAGAWYAEALQWASANGVVKGVSETRFNPNGKVTRQEFVSMLCRYVGGEASSSASLDSFPDANQAAQWAHTELCWAVENGVINGVKDSSGVLRLNPTGTATRAEIAQLMKNYMERSGT